MLKSSARLGHAPFQINKLMNTALQPTAVAELSRSLFQLVIFEVTRNALHKLCRWKPPLLPSEQSAKNHPRFVSEYLLKDRAVYYEVWVMGIHAPTAITKLFTPNGDKGNK
jgi:hypothetical protein